jgi:putative transposase
MPDLLRPVSRYLDELAENPHRPTLRREQRMQRFLSAHATVYGHFRPGRHGMTAAQHRHARAEAFRIPWEGDTRPDRGLISRVLCR